MNELLCDSCGKNMTDIDGSSMIGVAFQMNPDPGKEEFVKKQMGKYSNKMEYNFCYECWIGSFMSK